jgi:NAD(P)-dependent dehydrogenase (short-subunit alcohol dehydrogenase family)
MATILITGANQGLGFEFTRQNAADGWNVIASISARWITPSGNK